VNERKQADRQAGDGGIRERLKGAKEKKQGNRKE